MKYKYYWARWKDDDEPCIVQRDMTATSYEMQTIGSDEMFHLREFELLREIRFEDEVRENEP